MVQSNIYLSIKGVPTVVSNYQEDNIDSESVTNQTLLGCGRNCLGNCCLAVSRFPLYKFKKDHEEVSSTTEDESQPSFLRSVLLSEWDNRMRRNLFRYDVTTCETKILPGKYRFVAQLNEGRHLKKRPTEFRVDQVLQPFDQTKFNYTKIGQEEVLFLVDQGSENTSQFVSSATASDLGLSSLNVVAINVSPIEYGHVLLVPHVAKCLPQRIDRESLLLALRMAKEIAEPWFRLGYNSLGAFATINHLHFQAYYLAAKFPVELVSTRRISLKTGGKDRGVIVSELLNYAVRGLVFEGGITTRDLSNAVSSSCIYLQENNVSFNVLISDCGKRIFLFPQSYAEKQALGEVDQDILDTQVNPAVWEISGHMVLKRKKDFEDASEESMWRLISQVSLSEERFNEVKDRVMKATGYQEEEEDHGNNTKSVDYEPPSPRDPSYMPCPIFDITC